MSCKRCGHRFESDDIMCCLQLLNHTRIAICLSCAVAETTAHPTKGLPVVLVVARRVLEGLANEARAN